MVEEEKREIILENYQHPFNYKDEDNKDYIKVNSRNQSCIDNLDIYLKIEDNIIKDIYFKGEACAVSTSSTSILLKNIIGKKISEAKDYINNFLSMVNEEEYDEDKLNEAIAYDKIYKQGNRKGCAILPYNSIIKVLNEYN